MVPPGWTEALSLLPLPWPVWDTRPGTGPQVGSTRAPYLRLRLLVGRRPSVADLAPVPRVLVGSSFFQFSFRPPLSHEEIVDYPEHQSLWEDQCTLLGDKPFVKAERGSPCHQPCHPLPADSTLNPGRKSLIQAPCCLSET